MAFPLLGGAVAAVVAGLSAFLASRAAWILTGLGVGFFTMKGMQTLAGFVIADMQTVIAALNGSGSLENLGHVGVIMAQFAAYVGLFDAINIVIGAYMAAYGMVAMRVVLRRLQG